MKTTESTSPFKKTVSYAKKQLSKIQESMGIITQKLENDDIHGAYLKAFDLADAAEKFTLTARHIPAYTGNPQARQMSKQVISDNIPVKVGFTPEGWFGVVMPTLLPKKYKGNSEYIMDYMYPAMQNFFRGKQPVKYTNCVLIFRHIYQHDRPERMYRDHDNIEVKAVTDIIALYVLFDDSPLHCSNYHCSASGDENRTEIFVVPQNEFETWYANSKIHKNKELALYENRP